MNDPSVGTKKADCRVGGARVRALSSSTVHSLQMPPARKRPRTTAADDASAADSLTVTLRGGTPEKPRCWALPALSCCWALPDRRIPSDCSRPHSESVDATECGDQQSAGLRRSGRASPACSSQSPQQTLPFCLRRRGSRACPVAVHHGARPAPRLVQGHRASRTGRPWGHQQLRPEPVRSTRTDPVRVLHLLYDF